MIEKIKSFIESQSGDMTVFQFDNNRFIKSVVIVLEEDFADLKDSEIVIKYAQNGITTDLIPFGEAVVADSKRVEVSIDTPVSASHIYVNLNGINVRQIEIFEVLKEKVKNYYPSYFDTDLKENYFLDTVSVFTSPVGYCEYSVYTSLNGRDFEFFVRKTDDKPCDMSIGDVYSANGREARIIRVYIEYNSASVDALFDRVEFTGKKSGTEIKNRPEINIPDFKVSEYDVEITADDTYEEIYGIIARRLGEAYKSWFEFELCENPKLNGYDFFELSFKNEKVHIRGNCGVSLATGLNHYL